MPRQARGLLGVKKDPKNAILFSFNVRDGEEWPSDDSDSDYDPRDVSYKDELSTSNTGRQSGKRKEPQQTNMAAKKMKTTKGTENENESKKKNHSRSKNATTANGMDGEKSDFRKKGFINSNVPELPSEIWEKIFGYIVEVDGAIPFLGSCAPRVCRQWNGVSGSSHLWKKVDLSFGWLKLNHNVLNRICCTHLRECQTLDMSNCALLKSMPNIQCIADNCTKLKSINLSNCNKLPKNSVSILVEACKHLEDIDLTSTTTDSVSAKTLEDLSRRTGSNLRLLNLSCNTIPNYHVLYKIMDKCPNLQHLDLSNVRFSSGYCVLDIERFQNRCPQMKTLGLANSRFMASKFKPEDENLPGFEHLEELSMASSTDVVVSEDKSEMMKRLLKSSVKLRLLDIRGCKGVSIGTLESLPATNLQHLYLTRYFVDLSNNLHQVLQKWKHSLITLDLSWNVFSTVTLDFAVVMLCSDPKAANLAHLNMAGTTISMDLVKKLVTSLPSLRSLDLTSCRDIARGCKREYKTPEDMKTLGRLIRKDFQQKSS